MMFINKSKKYKFKHTILYAIFASIGTIAFLQTPLALAAGDAPPKEVVNIKGEEAPILFEAIKIEYDRELAIITAQGDVVIFFGGRTLEADRVIYNERDEWVKALGNVRLTDIDGSLLESDEIKIDKELKNGIIKHIKLLLADDSRFVGAGGRLTGGDRTEIANGIYTPCKLCKSNPNDEGSVLWQLKADRIIRNQTAGRVEYYNPRLEFFGLPVLYSPYLTHPDPTIKRQSGILAPAFGSDGNTGAFFQTSYFLNIADDKDLTFKPILLDDYKNLLLLTQYRQAFETSDLEINTGIIESKERKGGTSLQTIENKSIRWHVNGDYQIDFNDTWRSSINVKQSSDKNYRTRYNGFIDSSDFEESEANLEGFKNRQYVEFSAGYFSDIRPNSNANSIVLLPNIQYEGLGEADAYGGRWALSSQLLGIDQSGVGKQQAANLEGSYRLPYLLNWGGTGYLESSLLGNVISSRTDENFVTTNITDRKTSTADFIPRLSGEIAMPFVKQSAYGQTIIEPKASIHIIPDIGTNNNLLSIENTSILNTDASIFSANNFSGISRVETGTHGGLGTSVNQYFPNGGQIDLFLGRSFRLTENSILQNQNDLEKGLGDWLGQVEINPIDLIDFHFFGRYDPDSGRVRNFSAQSSLGRPALTFSPRYDYIRNTSTSNERIAQVSATVSSAVTENWSLNLSGNRDLNLKQTTSAQMGLLYQDECSTLGITFKRDYITTAEQEESDSFLITFTLKNLVESN